MSGADDARGVVLRLLLDKGDFPTRRFATAVESAGLTGRDRGFARQLLAGTIRRRRALDAIFKPFCSRRQVDPAVLWTLRLAIYQRFFLDQVPAYAAFNATLQSARPLLDKAVGFANAVLRAVDRAVVTQEAPDAAPDATLLPAGTRAWRFDRPLFPDPVAAPAAYWSVVLSYPEELARRWFEAAGATRARARMECLDRTPPLGLRVNPLRADAERVSAALGAAGLAPQPGPLPGSLVVSQPSGEVRRLPGYAEGWWSVQDLAAQQAIALADPRPGERVLDLCAAPGGKAFAACEHSGGQAEVVACDVDHARLRLLEPEARRLGHRVASHVIGADGAGVPEGPWDLVVLDVPCTNTGVLGRRPEARWRFGAASLEETVETQRRIAEAARPLLGPGTRVLWTTCSLEPEENRIAAVWLAASAGLRVAEEFEAEPDETRSGGYAALLLP